MRDRRARWAVPLLLALAGCEGQGKALEAGEGASVDTSIGCPEGGGETLSQTELRVMPLTGAGEAQYCGKRGTYVLVSPTLANDCLPNGRRCPR